MYMAIPSGGSIRFMEQQTIYCETLAEALDQASSYLAMGLLGTSIQTPDGQMIDGADLFACCQGEKTLNEDLSIAQA
jgi:hypothetical protein